MSLGSTLSSPTGDWSKALAPAAVTVGQSGPAETYLGSKLARLNYEKYSFMTKPSCLPQKFTSEHAHKKFKWSVTWQK